jgi:hypothetical protein
MDVGNGGFKEFKITKTYLKLETSAKTENKESSLYLPQKRCLDIALKILMTSDTISVDRTHFNVAFASSVRNIHRANW